MFFLLSKTLDIFISPAFWMLVFLGLALFARTPQRRKRWLWILTGWFLFFSSGPIAGFMWRLNEARPVPITTLPHHDVAIILGGFTDLTQEPQDRVYLSQPVDRLMHPIFLHSLGKVDRFIITGGSGVVAPQVKTTEAASVYQVQQTCVGSRIPTWLEDKSRNTRENALYCKVLIDSLVAAGQLPANPRILLVTSGFHMRRAHACYAKVGLNVTSFPVDFRGLGWGGNFVHLLLPNAAAFHQWEVLLRELIGYATYRVLGYC